MPRTFEEAVALVRRTYPGLDYQWNYCEVNADQRVHYLVIPHPRPKYRGDTFLVGIGQTQERAYMDAALDIIHGRQS